MNTNQKTFTPGPWLLSERAVIDNLGYRIHSCTGEPPRYGIIADVRPIDDDYSGSERRANALLIAAAPDLHEALCALVNNPAASDAIRTAKDALAKANGAV